MKRTVVTVRTNIGVVYELVCVCVIYPAGNLTLINKGHTARRQFHVYFLPPYSENRPATAGTLCSGTITTTTTTSKRAAFVSALRNTHCLHRCVLLAAVTSLSTTNSTGKEDPTTPQRPSSRPNYDVAMLGTSVVWDGNTDSSIPAIALTIMDGRVMPIGSFH